MKGPSPVLRACSAGLNNHRIDTADSARRTSGELSIISRLICVAVIRGRLHGTDEDAAGTPPESLCHAAPSAPRLPNAAPLPLWCCGGGSYHKRHTPVSEKRGFDRKLRPDNFPTVRSSTSGE